MKDKFYPACGTDYREGYHNVDRGGRLKLDQQGDILTREFWDTIPDNQFCEVQIRHFLEHIPHQLPAAGEKDGLIWFMEQVYRVCKPDALIVIAYPHHQANGAYGDPTHTRFITAGTLDYFDAVWRDTFKFHHYGIKTDIQGSEGGNRVIWGRYAKYDEGQVNLIADHSWNVIYEMVLERYARKPMRVDA